MPESTTPPPAAWIVTVSDRVSAGEATDEGGPAVARVLQAAGFDVAGTSVVPDEVAAIQEAIREGATSSALVVTTGGTGFAPRDVTPEATRAVLDRDAPGLAEAMRAAGRANTPFADLSRGVAGIVGSAIVLNTPGSPKGAVESVEAVVKILPHAITQLHGETGHH